MKLRNDSTSGDSELLLLPVQIHQAQRLPEQVVSGVGLNRLRWHRSLDSLASGRAEPKAPNLTCHETKRANHLAERVDRDTGSWIHRRGTALLRLRLVWAKLQSGSSQSRAVLSHEVVSAVWNGK